MPRQHLEHLAPKFLEEIVHYIQKDIQHNVWYYIQLVLKHRSIACEIFSRVFQINDIKHILMLSHVFITIVDGDRIDFFHQCKISRYL